MVMRVLFITASCEAVPESPGQEPGTTIARGTRIEIAHVLVQIFPRDVYEPCVEVAGMHVERLLQRLGLLERANGEFRPLVGAERLVALDAAAAIPEEHAATVERPDGVLWGLAVCLLMACHALKRFPGKEEGVLTPCVSGR